MKKDTACPLQKNQIVELSIDDLGSKGEGIGHFEGLAVFIEGALPGEQVRALIIKVNASFAVGKLLEVLASSPDRVTPVCSFFPKCGGCQLMHLSYEGQLRYKAGKIANVLERIGHFDPAGDIPIIGMSPDEISGYRNKAQYPVQSIGGAVSYGFYAARSHRLVPVTECFIQSSEANTLIPKIVNFANSLGLSAYDEMTGKGLLRHVLIRESKLRGNCSVLFVINGSKLPKAALWADFMREEGVASFSVNQNTARDNVILGPKTETIFGEEYIEDSIGPVIFRISPLSFYQVNSVQTERLYAKALEFASLTGSETVLDAYCGIGTISLFLAQKAQKVYGVEVVPEAIENAKQNACENGFDNTDFRCGPAEDLMPAMFANEGIRPDVIVVDPPRAGCEKAFLDAVAEAAPDRMVYVSCDPATLARDLDYLCHEKQAFVLEKVCGVDMFPHTAHVETVVRLARKH